MPCPLDQRHSAAYFVKRTKEERKRNKAENRKFGGFKSDEKLFVRRRGVRLRPAILLPAKHIDRNLHAL
jgi:hypothetical protein